MTESRRSLCFQMDFPKDKISKDNAKLCEFTFLLPKSMSNHELGMINLSQSGFPCKAPVPEQSLNGTCSKSDVRKEAQNLGNLGLFVPNISNSSSDI